MPNEDGLWFLTAGCTRSGRPFQREAQGEIIDHLNADGGEVGEFTRVESFRVLDRP